MARRCTTGRLLPVMLSLAACGSSSESQTLEIVTDRWDAYTDPRGACEDGTVCYNYRYSELTTEGIVRNLYGCRPGNVSGETSKDFFCKVHSIAEKQLSIADLKNLKRKVIEADPTALGDLYHCVCNDTCTEDSRTRTLFVIVDGAKSATSWTGGGASASQSLLEILEAIEKVGML